LEYAAIVQKEITAALVLAAEHQKPDEFGGPKTVLGTLFYHKPNFVSPIK